MSRARVRMSCALATVLVLSVGCSAQPPRVIAEKLCARLDQAYANHDLNQVLTFIDSSFVLTNERGKREAFTDVRKRLAQDFPQLKSMNQSTTVQDVQLEAGRMVVNYKVESHFEFKTQSFGWAPEIHKETGEATWEKKGGEWKLVRETVFRADTQFDPKWVELKQQEINDFKDLIKCADHQHTPGDGCPR